MFPPRSTLGHNSEQSEFRVRIVSDKLVTNALFKKQVCRSDLGYDSMGLLKLKYCSIYFLEFSIHTRVVKI